MHHPRADATERHAPLRVGAIGVGNMGQHHTRIFSLLPDVELVGVADIDVERGLAIAQQYQIGFYESYRELLPHVDAACIAVPTRLHYRVGLDCLHAGVHVLMEKPIAASLVEAEALVEAATAAGAILQVGHIERFNPTFSELRQILQAETPLALEAHRLSPHPQQASDVSVVMDLMIHDLDLLLELMAAPPVKLAASGSQTASSQQLDYVTATVGFANGLLATLTASKVAHRKTRRIAAHCQHALAEADLLGNEVSIYRHAAARGSTDCHAAWHRQDCALEQVQAQQIEPLHAEIAHFIRCIRNGARPSVGGEQALQALRLATWVEQMALTDRADTCNGAAAPATSLSPLPLEFAESCRDPGQRG